MSNLDDPSLFFASLRLCVKWPSCGVKRASISRKGAKPQRKLSRSDFALVAAYLLESRLCVENQ